MTELDRRDFSCQSHSGFDARLKHLEGDLSTMWNKINSVTNLLVANLVAVIMTLLGVIASYIKGS